MKIYKKSIGVLLGLFLLIRFFGGIFTDNEFNEVYFFIKNKPNWKFSFYSPAGLDDFKELNTKEQYEQKMYDYYVKNAILKFYLF